MPTKSGYSWRDYVTPSNVQFAAGVAKGLYGAYTSYNRNSGQRRATRRSAPRYLQRTARRTGMSRGPSRRFTRSAGKRSFKRVGRRVRRSRPGKPSVSFKKKVFEAINPPRLESLVITDRFVVPASVAVNLATGESGLHCTYGSFASNCPVGMLAPVVLKRMAYIDDNSTNPPLSYKVMNKFQALHKMSNDSNFSMKITGFLLEARRDLPAAGRYTTNILDDLGFGFAQSGIFATLPNASNPGMSRLDLSIYNANTFLSDYKIVKRRTKVLKPGQVTFWKTINTKPKSWNPGQYLTLTPGSNWSSVATIPLFVDVRGDQYWFWRFESAQSGINAAGTVADIGGKCTVVTSLKWEWADGNTVNPFSEMLQTIPTTAIIGNTAIAAPATLNIMNDLVGSIQTAGFL